MTRKDDLEKYHDFYKGKRATIYNEFKSRFVSSDVATADKFPLRDFIYQNLIRVIQNERVNFIPVEFEVSVSRGGKPDDALTDMVLEWLEEPFFGGEKTLWEALPGYYLCRENFGDLFLKLFVKDGIRVQKMLSEDVTILCDPKDVRTVTGYIFEWYQTVDIGEDNEQEVKMKEEIDGKAYRVYQKDVLISEEPHGFDFIPVVKITREEQEGNRYGRSGIEDLIEPQIELNAALTKRAWATKHNSFRVWAPKNSGEDVNDNVAIKISPGSLCPFPLEAVGGDMDLICIENELEDCKNHLFRLGSVPNPEKSEGLNTNLSAVALNKMLEPLRKYTRGKLPYLKKGFAELIEKAFLIEGKEITVSINYPNLEMEDRALLLQEAKYYSEQDFEEKALEILGVDKVEREKMEEDREKTQQERDQRHMEFQKKMMDRGEIDGEDDDE